MSAQHGCIIAIRWRYCKDGADGAACPRSSTARHLEAAAALGVDTRGAAPGDAGEILARGFIDLMRTTGLPSGIAALGYLEADVPALAEGAFAQQRPLVMAPRSVAKSDLEGLYRDAMRYW